MNELTITTPAQLLELAVTQGAKLKELEKLMNLQERWEAKEAKKEFKANFFKWAGLLLAIGSICFGSIQYVFNRMDNLQASSEKTLMGKIDPIKKSLDDIKEKLK